MTAAFPIPQDAVVTPVPGPCACGATEDVVLAGELDVCRACVPKHAWHCWKCNRDEVETIVIVTSYGQELFCSKCHTGVDPVYCLICEIQTAADGLRRDEDGEPLCRACFRDDSCPNCGGSGGGDYDGIECLVCRGSGANKTSEGGGDA